MYDRTRKRLYHILAISDKKDTAGVLFDAFLYVSICLNIIFPALLSLNILSGSRKADDLYRFIYSASIFFYALELAARIWTCTEREKFSSPVKGRIRFMLSPLIIVDLLVILSFVLFHGAVNIIFLRAVRLMQVSHYIGNQHDYAPYQLIRRAIRNRKEELIITGIGALVTLIICSYLIYFIEKSAQPAVFDSINPSIRWVFGVLTNTDLENFRPITAVGKILHVSMIVIGVLIIGLPLGIITGGFISEIEDAKKNIKLRQNANLLSNAFEREPKITVRSVVDELDLQHESRWIDLDFMSARLQYAPNEIFETVRNSAQLRIRAIKKSKESVFEDNLVVEHFPANTSFGVHQQANTRVHIIATQNHSDPGIGHFSRILAAALDSAYYSNEYYSSADLDHSKRINFAKNDAYLTDSESADPVFNSWKKCLYENIRQGDLVIYIATSGRKTVADFHVLCGGAKGIRSHREVEHPTFTDITRIEEFHKSLESGLANIGATLSGHTHIRNTEKNHCSQAIRKNTGADVLTLYVNTEFMVFTEPGNYYRAIRILCDKIKKYLLPHPMDPKA